VTAMRFSFSRSGGCGGEIAHTPPCRIAWSASNLKPITKVLPLSLAAALLLLVGRLPGQQPLPLPTALNIVVLEGEGSINDLHQRTARETIVRVEDENHKPLAGAAVVFTLPTEGATGEFANGSKTLTVITDSQGLAKAQVAKLNQTNGKMPIHVSASYRGLTARANITQFVSGGRPGAEAKSGHGHTGTIVAVLAVVAAAAAGGGYYAATRGSSSAGAATIPSGPSPIGITLGTGVIAPPH
jgi:hypothetical protein